MDAIPGRLKLPGDSASDLEVRLEIDDGQISLRSESADLGTWPKEAVDIIRMSEGTFSLTAEGDRLTFLPDDAEALAGLDIVSAYTPPAPEKKRRREPRTRTTRRDAAPRQRSRAELVTSEEAPPQVQEPGGQQAVHSRPRMPRGADRAARKARTSAARSLQSARDRLSKRRNPRAKLPSISPETKQKVAAASAAGMGWSKRRLRLGWLWALDHLRQTDIYGLDRIPVVTEEMRLEADHVHTFETRIAGAGLSRQVCTGCGKVIVTNE